MMSRKRYYNSFFEQIQEYKQNKDGVETGGIFNSNHQVLGAGLFASFLSFFVFGGYLNQYLPSQDLSGLAQYVRVDNRLAADVFRIDRSSADMGPIVVQGTEVFPLDDAVVDVTRPRSSDGERPYLEIDNTRRAYLKFSTQGNLVRGERVMFYVWMESGDGATLRLGLSEEVDWSERLLTAESAPEIVKLDVLPVLDEVTGAYVFDITDDIAGVNSFTLELDSNVDSVVYAKESSTRSPRLSITTD